MKKIASKMTMDKLAGMVQRGFEDINDNLEKINCRFDKIDFKLNEIEIRIEALEKVIHDEYHGWIIRLEDRIQKLEADFRSILGGKLK